MFFLFTIQQKCLRLFLFLRIDLDSSWLDTEYFLPCELVCQHVSANTNGLLVLSMNKTLRTNKLYKLRWQHVIGYFFSHLEITKSNITTLVCTNKLLQFVCICIITLCWQLLLEYMMPQNLGHVRLIVQLLNDFHYIYVCI